MEKDQIQTQIDQNQPSPEVLNEGTIGHFRTIREDLIELNINSIEPFHLIPDYRDPTESIYPIIIKSPEVCRCVDGWDLIEDAKTAGKASLRCHVFEMENHSDVEFAIRKVSVRTKPQGGTCSYPETLRNTRLLVQLIMAGNDNVAIFSHGGARRGGNFTSNREDDLREMLVERLGKSRTTINTYLNQSEYVSDIVFDALIGANVGRTFFEKCRVIKRDLIKHMQSEEVQEAEITAAISEKMLQWLDEFSRTGNVSSVHEEADAEVPDENEPSVTQTDEVLDEMSEDENFQHHTRADQSDSQVIPTEEDVQNEIQRVVSVLSDIAEQPSLEFDANLETIDAQILILARIRQMLLDIKNSMGPGEEEEAA